MRPTAPLSGEKLKMQSSITLIPNSSSSISASGQPSTITQTLSSLERASISGSASIRKVAMLEISNAANNNNTSNTYVNNNIMTSVPGNYNTTKYGHGQDVASGGIFYDSTSGGRVLGKGAATLARASHVSSGIGRGSYYRGDRSRDGKRELEATAAANAANTGEIAWASKGFLRIDTLPYDNDNTTLSTMRSKSAGVPILTVQLPPMAVGNATRISVSSGPVNIPTLPLRYIQSAPTVSRGAGRGTIAPMLPPIMSKTPNHKVDKVTPAARGLVPPSALVSELMDLDHDNNNNGRRSQSGLAMSRFSTIDNQSSNLGVMRKSKEQEEQEGGILAPRRG